MAHDDSAQHWDAVYRKSGSAVSWYQLAPTTSVRLVTGFAGPGDPVVDVGAGESRLVDALLERGWSDVTLVDVCAQALASVERRVAPAQPIFVVTDLLDWEPDRTFALWHDRAVFHFLVDDAAIRAYVALAARSVTTGGHLVLATFASDGPTSCSGLPTARYDESELARIFAAHFELVVAEREQHLTPGGAEQHFTWVVLRRTG